MGLFGANKLEERVHELEEKMARVRILEEKMNKLVHVYSEWEAYKRNLMPIPPNDHR